MTDRNPLAKPNVTTEATPTASTTKDVSIFTDDMDNEMSLDESDMFSMRTAHASTNMITDDGDGNSESGSEQND